MNKKTTILALALFGLTLMGPLSARRTIKKTRVKVSTCNRIKASTSCKRSKSCSWVRSYKSKRGNVRGYCRMRKSSKRSHKMVKPSKRRTKVKRCLGLKTKTCRSSKSCTWKYKAKKGSKRRVGYCAIKKSKRAIRKKYTRKKGKK